MGYRRGFERFGGQIVTAADPLDSTVAAEVDVASFDTGLEAFNRHLLAGDFFDVANYPTATLSSTAIRPAGDRFHLDADLTLRGITKAVTFELEVLGFGFGVNGETKAGFSASATVNRGDFGIAFQSVLANGNLAVSDEARILLEIEAVLRADQA
ncbi:YceI family protein [Actinokineospora iranica]|uniref:Polyisoprenoid-binding protein YceI n=1 Tax=Actinokineospora iranica TaxID=1271860 RepID=A0A1G6WEG9_9PSEU|nr:YceI family protein [Actinokineospora iranica]SDD63465.1 Polyisoprenoid-binding protein YceI [Actinokineospora iranica]